MRDLEALRKLLESGENPFKKNKPDVKPEGGPDVKPEDFSKIFGSK